MPAKANQRPEGGKVKTPPPQRNALPLYLAGGALLVIIIGVLLWSNLGRASSGGSPTQVAGGPKVAVDREQIDFGNVPLDKPVKAIFKLSNVGDQTLQILGQPVIEVKQGC
jgi:hypothetical protein